MTTWINIKLIDPKCKPERKTVGAVGYDLVAREAAEVRSSSVAKIPTGVCLELPPSIEAQVRPRSGLSLRGAIAILGTVDPDYRGEVSVILHNTTLEPFFIAAGERIAQLVFARVELPVLSVVEELGATVRGSGGFGSTDPTPTAPVLRQLSSPYQVSFGALAVEDPRSAAGFPCPICTHIRPFLCQDCGACIACHESTPQAHGFTLPHRTTP